MYLSKSEKLPKKKIGETSTIFKYRKQKKQNDYPAKPKKFGREETYLELILCGKEIALLSLQFSLLYYHMLEIGTYRDLGNC